MSYFPYIFGTGSAHSVSEHVTKRKRRPVGFAPPVEKSRPKRKKRKA